MRGLEIRGLTDYTRATLDDGSNVPRVPLYRVGGGVTFVSTAFDAGALFTHAGRQDRFGLFDSATPGFNQLMAQVALRPFKAYPGIAFAVIGQNLTDRALSRA